MAEDLTEYAHDQGVRVRYMHSDIDTLERIEIIRDLRLGAFDVLIGINLLREGLDIPECALVAILDADKEGFLRSETSLVQTIGRAARNVEGRVILYADRVTGSMQRAIDETDRRREKQIAYNTEHGIVPKTVAKNVGDILDSLYDDEDVTSDANDPLAEVATVGHNFEAVLQDLEQKMMKAAEDLEFEEAARLRDEIKRLKDHELLVANDPLSKRFTGSDLSVPSIDKKRKSRLKKNNLDEMGPSTTERPLLSGASDAHKASARSGASDESFNAPSDAHYASGAIDTPSDAHDASSEASNTNDEISDTKQTSKSKKKTTLSKKARPRSSGGKPGTRTKKGKSHRSGL